MFNDKIQEIAGENFMGHYFNYIDHTIEKNWQEKYFGDNFAKLQNLKKKYDPENLFARVYGGIGIAEESRKEKSS